MLGKSPIKEFMPSDQFRFHISDAAQSFGLKAVCFVIEGVRNQRTNPEFEKLKAQTLAQVSKDLSSEAIQTDPILSGFRALHDAIGRSNRKNVASPESLLKLVLQTGGLPRVNLLVDIYNLVSVKTRLSLGAHDLSAISGNVQLRLTDGSETFWPMGSDKPKSRQPRRIRLYRRRAQCAVSSGSAPVRENENQPRYDRLFFHRAG